MAQSREKQPKAIRWIGGINGYLKILDQTYLPHKVKFINCKNVSTLCEAIKSLRVRGAPLIGIAAAYGIVLAAKSGNNIEVEAKKIVSTRPTAVNLKWAVERMLKVTKRKELLLNEAIKIHEEDKRMCDLIGYHGNKRIKKNAKILTLCNTGALATGGKGTAFSVVLTAKNSGKNPTLYACETRPLLQGARLTMWEAKKSGIKAILICDSAAASIMKNENIDTVIVGADRIAANGDTANKVGTYALALAAKENNIPFYVAAPISTFDLSIKNGGQIRVENRLKEEVIKTFAPKESRVLNPAFDITPAKLITGFITDKGVKKVANGKLKF